MILTINRSDEYKDISVSAPYNKAYVTIDTSDWINKPWMFYELPSLKFEIYTETNGELVKYQNFTREIRTYNPVYSPLGVLNVTIDIRNVPEEFILRITPIFDNDAIAARNMLIENGIENGEIWGKDQDIPTQSFDLNIEFIECTGEYIPPIPPTHEETVTFTEPPYTFDDSDGSPIISLTIKGNGQQNGTPSPQNIVPFDGTGERTGNLAPPLTEWVDGYLASNGAIAKPSESYKEKSSDFLEIPTNAANVSFSGEDGVFEVGMSGAWRAIAFYDSDMRFILRAGGGGANYISASVPENAKFMRISCRTYESDKEYMLNSGSAPLPYEPYGYKTPFTCAGQTIPVYLGQTPTVRRVKKLVLTGDENYTAGSVIGQIRTSITGAINSLGLCTHYILKASYGGARPYIRIASNILWFELSPDGYETKEEALADFKAYIAAQYAAGTPVTVWYVLATEQTGIVNEPLYKIGDYADTLTTSTPIPTAKGSNTLSVDTTVQPSEMTITYIKEGQ